tara:strand:- start:2467 stop:2616 length:150 start_codon:yes stop_codon:yes gene_type:complete
MFKKSFEKLKKYYKILKIKLNGKVHKPEVQKYINSLTNSEIDIVFILCI